MTVKKKYINWTYRKGSSQFNTWAVISMSCLQEGQSSNTHGSEYSKTDVLKTKAKVTWLSILLTLKILSWTLLHVFSTSFTWNYSLREKWLSLARHKNLLIYCSLEIFITWITILHYFIYFDVFLTVHHSINLF
jgi:hypothetical protein